MPDTIAEKLDRQRRAIIGGMLSYLAMDPDCAEYSDAEIESCDIALKSFLLDMKPNLQESKIITAIHTLVQRLNELNALCGHTLIETDAREDICGMIIEAQQLAGLASEDDLTFEWREW